MNDAPWIRFDIPKIEELKQTYEAVIKFILKELPDVNWNSPKETVRYFSETLDIPIPNAKIKTIANLMACYDEHSYEFEVISGLTYYLKLKYSLKNHIGAILRHEVNGIVTLRLHDGEWTLPNKQPVSLSPEITACILARHNQGATL